ncbi:hypothetical protein GCM10010329_80400 [Streptomyces spiroverticillatus]|uniref:Uncharacterized protein n=1 Tax=Streptomyces finlayi TaxID=67296 RepID=A0A918X6S9_9ACTN|nr:hypothetical protein [Streptomyces finlayi]GHA45800.1 hypothetical protein GCM10010329_80400 [Streptomyces spiroverticillatus]GHD15861.1 hypothetical protein GCM10010334_76320 [Streptomyces finlayi]
MSYKLFPETGPPVRVTRVMRVVHENGFWVVDQVRDVRKGEEKTGVAAILTRDLSRS